MAGKGIDVIVSLLFLILILIFLAVGISAWLLKSSSVPEKAYEKSEENLESGLTSTLILDHYSQDSIYLKNIGTTEFNNTIAVYFDDIPACIRRSGTTKSYIKFLPLDVKPDKTVKLEVGCCLVPGTRKMKISTGYGSTTEVIDVKLRQPIFIDWNRTPDYENTMCMVLNYANCSSGDYQDCNVTNEVGLRDHILSLAQSSSWYLEDPPYTWNISKDGSNLCCRCGHCFGMVAKVNFFYNSGALKGKKIWLSGDATEPECKNGDVDGIYLNDNMYLVLNGNLSVWNGTSYNGIYLGGPVESKQWCIKPIDLSGSSFSLDCNWNEVLIYFEDFCQSGEKEAGGVYGLRLTVK